MPFEDPKLQYKHEGGEFSSRVSDLLRTMDSYEEAEKLLTSVDERIAFRKSAGFTANFAFVDVVEDCYDAAITKDSAHFLAREAYYYGKMVGMSPRVADFYQGFLAQVFNTEFQCRFSVNQRKIDELRAAQDFEVLFDTAYSLSLKANRLEKGLSGFVNSLRSLDKRDGNTMTEEVREERKQKLANQSHKPHPKRKTSKPGVDEMDRLKEGEKAHPIWTITPPWGGYYKEVTLTQWDNDSSTWSAPTSENKPYVLYPEGDKKNTHIMQATIDSGEEIPLPLPYTHGIVSVTTNAGTCEVLRDQFGDASVVLRGAPSADITITLVPVSKKPQGAPQKPPQFKATFTEKTEKELTRIASIGGSVARFQELKKHVFSHVVYLSPKDKVEADYYNAQYRNDPRGFAGAVDAIQKGDCDTVNTYFSALCSRLNITSRHCLGHMVQAKGESGGAEITSGTGHGWTEVWDDQSREWVRVDATPPGDPNMSEPEESQKSERIPGDFDSRESEQQQKELSELLELRKNVEELRKKLSYTKEERSIAEAAGISLSDARTFVKEIHEAEKMTTPKGDRILDVLSQVFSVILQSRKEQFLEYDGPVRRREGGERITNLVRHAIALRSGEFDPMSREREEEDEEVRYMSGGFDLFMIGDKSGSMGTSYKKETYLSFQQKVLYLITAAMHNFQSNVTRESLSKESDFTVRSEVVTFSPEIVVEKKLNLPLSSQSMYQLWGGLGKIGYGNDEVSALHTVINSIEEDKKNLKKKGQKEDRVRLVILCSDGGIMGDENIANIQVLMEQLTEMGALVVGVGLSPQANTIPICFHNPPKSYGHLLENIEELPIVVAKHVVSRAIALMPSDKKEEAEKLLADIIKKLS